MTDEEFDEIAGEVVEILGESGLIAECADAAEELDVLTRERVIDEIQETINPGMPPTVLEYLDQRREKVEEIAYKGFRLGVEYVRNVPSEPDSKGSKALRKLRI